MKFTDYEFFPGSVIDVEDPKRLGRVKAIVPTVFSDDMDQEGLPWIYPFTISGYQRFSKLTEGSKIWVLKNINNYNEFWYVPMFELNGDTRDLIGNKNEEDYDDGEVLLSRNLGSVGVYIYYNTSDGIMIKYGDNALININANNEITLKANDAQVVMKDNKVYVGDGKTGEPAVMGNKLKKELEKINRNFNKIKTAFPTMAPYPQKPPMLENVSSDVLADNTNVD